MRKILPVLIVVILAGFGFYYFNSNSVKETSRETTSSLTNLSGGREEEKVDRKASFAIFTNGTFRVFTASMYHNLSEDIFITAENPNIVSVKKSGVTWFNFFETLPMSVTKDCLTTGTGQLFCTGESGTLRFYLNGERDDNLLDKGIQDGDKVLISFGDESDNISSQLDKIPEPN